MARVFLSTSEVLCRSLCLQREWADLRGPHLEPCALTPACFGAQARANVAETKKRIAESEKRVDSKLGEFVDKKYWCARCLIRLSP